MSRKFPLALLLLFSALATVQAQETSPPDVLRGEVFIEMEPIYGAFVDPEYPLDNQTAGRRAMEEAALFYSAMIYGWSFHYEIGERARRIPEKLELVPEASIPSGDPRLRATDSEIKDMRLCLWTDYRMSEAQQRRVQVWRKSSIRGAQALGYCPPLSSAEGSEAGSVWLEVRKAALEEAALFYSAMIYGWSFHYDIGERARKIPEKLDLTPVATIPFGDPGLRATDVEIKDMSVRLWTDYRMTDAQLRRMQVWRKGNIRSAQAIGHGPLGGPVGASGWLEIKTAALEDAARAALRAALRGSERNRPKEVTGFISLAAFPRYFMESGHWAASARFYVDIHEIIPFAAH
jgi:hypothetical protein